nr:aspartate aminotransferase family protein [Flavobacteriaceae bacterium]
LEVILKEKAKKHGVAITVNHFGSMINPFFTNAQVTNFEEAQQCDTKKFATFFWEMIHNGIFLPPSQFEAWFLSSALSNRDVQKTSKAIDKAMEAVSKL